MLRRFKDKNPEELTRRFNSANWGNCYTIFLVSEFQKLNIAVVTESKLPSAVTQKSYWQTLSDISLLRRDAVVLFFSQSDLIKKKRKKEKHLKMATAAWCLFACCHTEVGAWVFLS